MAHFSTTFAIAGSSDTTRFGSLEFPALPPVGMWVPPIFESSQAFLFRSLDFIADQLDVLHLHEEAPIPAPVGGASSISFETPDDFNDEAPALHFEQTLCSNPAVSNVHIVIYSLLLFSVGYLEGLRCPHRNHHTTGSPMASHPPWMHTPRG